MPLSSKQNLDVLKSYRVEAYFSAARHTILRFDVLDDDGNLLMGI